ncbi:MAG TPA: response regulator transcription factor [Hyphomicrobiaceae bacterium]|jgi:DNA-binding response OmpR family regulator|nr:response regulator transcription factor [Hyphomicrobiaceae bacterium]
MGRVLVIDSDAILRKVLRACLEADGREVVEAESAAHGLAELEREAIDLITFDVGLEANDGIAMGRQLRSDAGTPILVVSANNDRALRNAALTEFADDYVLKPFDVHELLARTRALLRRTAAGRRVGAQASGSRVLGASPINIGGLKIDLEAYRVIDTKGNPVELSATEFRMLKALVTNPNRVLSREHLLELCGGSAAADNVDRAIDMRIRRLRQKLGQAGTEASDIIGTIRGVGYIFRTTGKAEQGRQRLNSLAAN